MYINKTFNITKESPSLNASDIEMISFFLLLVLFIVFLFLFCRGEYRKYQESLYKLNVFTGKTDKIYC